MVPGDKPMPNPQFGLSQIFATPGALEALQDGGQTPGDFLSRHAQGCWGDLCDGDKLANDQALLDGSRILSAYKTLKGVKLWIITEAADENGNRLASTILLPSEY
jgi:hypothetical protein